MKKIFYYLGIGILAATLCGCSGGEVMAEIEKSVGEIAEEIEKSKEELMATLHSYIGGGPKAAAKEMTEAFSDGSPEEVGQLILGVDEREIDEEVRELLGEDQPESGQDGILSSIFANSSITVESVGDGSVEFEIHAPDMSGVFQNLPANSGGFTEEDLLEYMKAYMEQADQRQFLVQLPYAEEDGEIVIDYFQEDFLNAMTGGLLEAYQQLYADELKEYQEIE